MSEENVEVVRQFYEAWTCSATSSPSSTTTRLTACRRSRSRRWCSPEAVTRARDPELGRRVAELIPLAKFEVMEEESHQPFQEIPDEWNARVDAFWHEVEARG